MTIIASAVYIVYTVYPIHTVYTLHVYIVHTVYTWELQAYNDYLHTIMSLVVDLNYLEQHI